VLCVTENSILAPRIHGELLKLGFEVDQSSVAKYMVKRCGPPSQGWRLFRERQLSILDRRRGPSMNASLHRKARLPFLKPDLAPNLIFAGHSYDCEASYLSLEWRRLLQFQRISTAAPRHFKIWSSSSARAVRLSLFSALNRLIEMNRHPFFVFGKRRVGLLEIEEFPRFVRRTRYAGEERPEFGCFGSILLRSEHLTRPFCGKREHEWCGAVGCIDWSMMRHMGMIAPISEISAS
jgi:hypothetical protein